MHTNLDQTHVVIDGQFVSQKVSQVVQAIREYSPELRVDWLPPEARKPGQAAFKIVHAPPGGEDYILFHVARDEDMDERVLQRIMVNDQRNGQTKYTELEAWEEAGKRVQHQKFLDQMEEAEDIAKHMVKSPLNRYKVNDDLIFEDGIPHNVAHVDDHKRPMRGSEQENGGLFG